LFTFIGLPLIGQLGLCPRCDAQPNPIQCFLWRYVSVFNF